jgi:hypothetical protein
MSILVGVYTGDRTGDRAKIHAALEMYRKNMKNPEWVAPQIGGVFVVSERIFVDGRWHNSIMSYMCQKYPDIFSGIRSRTLPVSSYLLRCLLDFYRWVCRLCTIDPSHDWRHVMRVVNLAFNLARVECPNMPHAAKIVLVMVSLLHDCMDRKVVAVGAREMIRAKLREIGRMFGMPFDFVTVVEALLAILPYSARKNRPESERYTVAFSVEVWAQIAEYFQLGSVADAQYWFSVAIEKTSMGDVIDAHALPTRVFVLSLNQIRLPFPEWLSNIAEVIRGERIYGASDDEYATKFVLDIIKCIRPALLAYCTRYLGNIKHIAGVKAAFVHRAVVGTDRVHKEAQFIGTGMLDLVTINI